MHQDFFYIFFSNFLFQHAIFMIVIILSVGAFTNFNEDNLKP